MHLKSGPDPILCYSSFPSRQPWIITWYCGAAASSGEVEPRKEFKKNLFLISDYGGPAVLLCILVQHQVAQLHISMSKSLM